MPPVILTPWGQDATMMVFAGIETAGKSVLALDALSVTVKVTAPAVVFVTEICMM
jgi:hypothetical protein